MRVVIKRNKRPYISMMGGERSCSVLELVSHSREGPFVLHVTVVRWSRPEVRTMLFPWREFLWEKVDHVEQVATTEESS